MKKLITSILVLISQFSVVFAQNPPALSANAPAYNFTLTIAENFNAGRRFEENNQSLTIGSLGTLTLPTNYSSLTLAQKALILVNAERVCRNGIHYNNGTVALLPFQDVETNLSGVAQTHANWLVAQNKFDHCGDPAFGTDCSVVYSSPSSRIQGRIEIKNGWESNEENIGMVLSNDPNSVTLSLANEKIIFDMIFRNGPNWVHRSNFLRAFNDNFGATGQEGFLGVGEKQATGYNPINLAGITVGKLLVYQMYDAKAGATNAFSVLSSSPDAPKYYRIIAKHNNKAMSVLNTSLTGSAVVQATMTDLASQKWKLVPTTDGYVKIISLSTGQALDIRWGSARQGARVNQWTNEMSSKSQEWKIVPTSNGFVQINNRNSGFSLSVPVYINNENFQLVQLNTVSYANNLWQIVEILPN